MLICTQKYFKPRAKGNCEMAKMSSWRYLIVVMDYVTDVYLYQLKKLNDKLLGDCREVKFVLGVVILH